jgi:hypothetical protein
MADIVCKSKGAAIAALDTIAGSMPNGTQRDTLLAIKVWVNKNMSDASFGISEAAKERLDRIFADAKKESAKIKPPIVVKKGTMKSASGRGNGEAH